MMLRTLWKEPERFVRSYFSQVEGCYFTNDAAVRDDDGHFWVTGRVDDVINVAGHRLSTMEMESAIMECGGIAEVAVVGMPDAIKGLVPAAFVTLKAGPGRLAGARTGDSRRRSPRASAGSPSPNTCSSPTSCPRRRAARSCGGC